MAAGGLDVVLMVTAMTWIVLPALTRLFRAWLLAATPAPAPVPDSRLGANRLIIDGHDRVQG